VKAFICKVR